ncbi:hypothetical protein Dsin_012224 [Dipteronia sinensis]|uniref:Uncharacterized protein n=1 Tax=Dipteronia sinensis TaxID=43782 RepID=A0AAE0AIY9_9ROSI|nr:hypothetical protein Dsin_012224 [Dipteronia sinensis]
MVPVTYERWSKVPSEIKERIWKRAKLYFKLEEWSKKQILSSTSSKWRCFKSHLTSTYIVPFKDKPEVLKHPPSIYDFVEQKHWEAFVRIRLSEEWTKFRQIQKTRQGKNIYHHRISRKGYANFEVELKRSLGSNNEIERSILWKEARVNKKGEYDNEADELMEKRKEEALSTSGSQDVLAMALESPEHRGQLRGLGQFVTPTYYFGRANSRLSFEEVRLMKERVNFLEETMEKMRQEIRTMKELGQTDNDANIDNSRKVSYEEQISSGYSAEDTSDVFLQKGTMKKPQSAEECLLPPLVKSLIGYANRLIDENGAIEIHMEAGIIDNESGCFYLMGDDILQFCEMEEISVTAILTYMRLLYDELKNRNMVDMYRFVDPSALSEETGYTNDHRARELLSRMMVVGPHQLLLLPFNAGAFTMFAEKIGKTDTKCVTWRMIKFNRRDAYSQAEIDEVRSEWAEFVGKFC